MNIQYIPTPRQYVYDRVVAFPTLYGSLSYEDSAYRVFDQLFNVIGNGVKCDTNLENELNQVVIVDQYDAEKYMTGEAIFWGYDKVVELSPGSFMPDHEEDGARVIALDSERHLHPSIKLWIQSNTQIGDEPQFRVPYPNFEERYSLIYNCNFLELGDEWIDAAIWFYKKSRDFFERNSEYYHYAFPCSNKRETDNRVFNFEKHIEKYSSYEHISEAYELEYTGDTVEFLTKRWQIELARIMKFIDDTITLLNSWKTK